MKEALPGRSSLATRLAADATTLGLSAEWLLRRWPDNQLYPTALPSPRGNLLAAASLFEFMREFPTLDLREQRELCLPET
jgi:hypothetical protein